MTRNQIRAVVAGLTGLVIGGSSYSFLGYPEWGLGIGLIWALVVWLVGGIRRNSIKSFAFPAAAFGAAFFLFMPFGCTSGSFYGAPGIAGGSEWDCQAILGLTLPGFSGTGRPSPSYLPPLLAGTIAALLTLVIVRRGKGADHYQP